MAANAREAKAATRDKAHDAKEKAHDAKDYVAHKAHVSVLHCCACIAVLWYR